MPAWFTREIFYLIHTSKEIEGELLKLAVKFQPDLILVLKGETILPKTLRKLKNLSSRPSLVNWWVDNPIIYDGKHKWLIFPHCVPYYDQLFIFDYSYFEPLKKLGARSVSFLPCAVDPSHYYPKDLTPDELSRLKCNICFIATFYKDRGDLIEPFLNIPGLAIWGGGWIDFFKKKRIKNIQNILRGNYLPIEDVNKAYQAATIVLNFHHRQTKIAGLNSRAFEIPATGGMQLTDYVPEMEGLLVPNEEVSVYKTPTEGAQLAKDLVNDPGTRNKIARAGYERVISEHTYVHRMQAILNKI